MSPKRGQFLTQIALTWILHDGVCDIRGARAVGLDTVYLRSNLSPDEPAPQASYVLEHMDFKRIQNILTEEETR